MWCTSRWGKDWTVELFQITRNCQWKLWCILDHSCWIPDWPVSSTLRRRAGGKARQRFALAAVAKQRSCFLRAPDSEFKKTKNPKFVPDLLAAQKLLQAAEILTRRSLKLAKCCDTQQGCQAKSLLASWHSRALRYRRSGSTAAIWWPIVRFAFGGSRTQAWSTEFGKIPAGRRWYHYIDAGDPNRRAEAPLWLDHGCKWQKFLVKNTKRQLSRRIKLQLCFHLPVLAENR